MRVDRLALSVDQTALHVGRIELCFDLTKRPAAGDVGDQGGGIVVGFVEFFEICQFGAGGAGAARIGHALAGVGGG